MNTGPLLRLGDSDRGMGGWLVSLFLNLSDEVSDYFSRGYDKSNLGRILMG